MKRFIKRNAVLVAVLTVAIVGTVFMMVFAISRYAKMTAAIKKTETFSRQIEDLGKQKPAPSQENIDVISSDLKQYEVEVGKMYRHFGQPYADALDTFYSQLGLNQQAEANWLKQYEGEEELPELTDALKADLHRKAQKQFYDYFKSYWDERNEDALSNAEIIRDFKSIRERQAALAEEDRDDFPYNWTAKSWEAAMDKFAEQINAEARTIEPVGLDNRDELLFASLGLPRDFDRNPKRVALYVKDIQRRLSSIYKENKIYLDPMAVDFSFYDMSSPGKGQIAYIGKVMEIIGDLGRRIAGPNPTKIEAENEKLVQEGKEPLPVPQLISEVWDFARVDLTEQDSENFEIFRFRVKALGTLESINALVERLNNAADDHRFYVVRRMKVVQLNDDAQRLMYEAGLVDEVTFPEDTVNSQSGMSAMGGMLGTMGGMARPNRDRSMSATMSGNRQNRPTRTGDGMQGMGMGMPGTTTVEGEEAKIEAPPRRTHRKLLIGTDGNSFGNSNRSRNPMMNNRNPMMQNNPMMNNRNPMMQNNPMMQMNPMLRSTDYSNLTEEELKMLHEQEDRGKPLSQRRSYAEPLIGADFNQEVELIIDYVVVSNKDFEQE